MTLRVKIEIVPWGVEEEAYEIGRLDISNIKQYGLGLCEYNVIQIGPQEDDVGLFNKTIEHRRQDGPWVLVEKALSELVNKEEHGD